MAFQLKVLTGPLQGQIFEIQPDYIIGRGSANIPLADSKISGQHAKFENAPTGELVLVDLDSRNGLQVDGVHQARIVLRDGLRIQIGNTRCEVLEISEIVRNALPGAAAKKSLERDEYLADFALRSLNRVKNKPTELAPFKPLVVLTVIQGERAGDEWVLGYGPRTIGAHSPDLVILDGPDYAFSVEPEEFSAKFSTLFPDKVLLNERSVLTEKLNDGDTISFATTRIRVSFKE